MTGPPRGATYPRLGRPCRPLPRGQLKAALETISNRPRGPNPLPTSDPRSRRPPLVRLHLGAPGPPGLPGGWAGPGGGKRRPADAGRGPGARCRWRRRRLRWLSLQLPLSPAPPPPPPPAFPRGLPRCQERPNPGSASSGVSQVSSRRRRRQGRGPRPAPARRPPAPPRPYLRAR